MKKGVFNVGIIFIFEKNIDNIKLFFLIGMFRFYPFLITTCHQLYFCFMRSSLNIFSVFSNIITNNMNVLKNII